MKATIESSSGSGAPKRWSAEASPVAAGSRSRKTAPDASTSPSTVIGSGSHTKNPARIGGLQKQSLIDYPGKMSCVLFFTGCNLDCPYCHNPALAKGQLTGSAVADQDELLEFLDQRRGFLDGVVISGGEPTVQAGLVQLCEHIRRLGYPLKLDTNGSRPRVLRHLIDRGLVDYIAMDIKTRPSDYRRYIQSGCDPAPFLDSIRLIMDAGVDYEFRTTCVRPIVTPAAVDAISRRVTGARRYVLQRFRDADVLHPEFFQNSQSHQYTPAQLDRLRAIAAPRVARCLVR